MGPVLGSKLRSRMAGTRVHGGSSTVAGYQRSIKRDERHCWGLRTLNPLGDTGASVDVYDRYRNMAVLTRGHIWVQPSNAVAASDAVYFDYATGDIGNSASGRSATGYVDFPSNPTAGQTVTLGAQAITFKASGAVAANLEVNIASTTADTVAALAAMLNASANTTIDDATYSADFTRLNISFDTPGAGGDAFGVVTNVTGATVSAATLTGSDDGSNAIGSIVFTVIPTEGKKITLNGVDILFKATPGASDIAIGIDLATTLASLKTDLNNAGAAPGNNAEGAKCTYDVVGSTLTVSDDTPGVAGNSYTISTDVTGATASGATLTGGVPVPVLLASAYWRTSSLADGLAIVSLGIQR
jgi:hypothetical protein